MTSSPKNSSVRGLSLEGVTVAFGGIWALEEVTLRVEPGERLAVIGASGAGKSTLFRTLTRSVALGGGRVLVGGRDLYALPRGELRDVRRKIGSIHQSYNLIPQLSAGVNAALGEVGGMGGLGTLRALLAGPDAALARRARNALERVGLVEKADARTAELSGGQQQRVAVARLLVQQPDLILADEPFAAVDPVTTERVFESLLELNREGVTLLINLHDVEIACRFPRIVALRDGRISFDGPPEHLTEERLARIYAGDPHETSKENDPEAADTRHCGEEPVRVTKGRDGVSAH
ncbi:MAG: ATP-binding cassette domain-containing protein [Actinomycetota bacterium]|nr:ATP-binding cassette domain-containing protein [Actinomycetota bacterium]